MAQIGTRPTEGGVEVLVGDRVLHRAASQEAADALARWIHFQLEGGTSLEALEAMMRGEAADPGEGARARAVEASGGSDGPDTRILEGSLGDLRAALDSGDHDAHLAALLEAERSGKARKGAIAAIEARIEAAD